MFISVLLSDLYNAGSALACLNYVLFKDAVSSSAYNALNDKLINEC
jgi:hypothetical protein